MIVRHLQIPILYTYKKQCCLILMIRFLSKYFPNPKTNTNSSVRQSVTFLLSALLSLGLLHYWWTDIWPRYATKLSATGNTELICTTNINPDTAHFQHWPKSPSFPFHYLWPIRCPDHHRLKHWGKHIGVKYRKCVQYSHHQTRSCAAERRWECSRRHWLGAGPRQERRETI